MTKWMWVVRERGRHKSDISFSGMGNWLDGYPLQRQGMQERDLWDVTDEVDGIY